MTSLYERIGGKDAVKATVEKLYEKILADDFLLPFFKDVDVNRLRASQAAFVTYAFGGLDNYSGKNLRQAHAKAVEHGLNDAHFDAVATHLKNAMIELNVPKELIEEAITIVGTTRDDVLNR